MTQLETYGAPTVVGLTVFEWNDVRGPTMLRLLSLSLSLSLTFSLPGPRTQERAAPSDL